MAKFFTSRVNALKQEARDIRNMINGESTHAFPMVLLTMICIAFVLVSLYIYFNVIRSKNA